MSGRGSNRRNTGSVINFVAVRRVGLRAGKRVMSDFKGRHFEGSIVSGRSGGIAATG